MNNEGNKATPVKIEDNEELIAGKHAANCFMESFEENSNQHVPSEHRENIHERLKNVIHEEEHEIMSQPFSITEMNKELDSLLDKKAPGPDKISNEMLKNLGNKAKNKLLQIFNNSFSSSKVPQNWREAIMTIYSQDRQREYYG